MEEHPQVVAEPEERWEPGKEEEVEGIEGARGPAEGQEREAIGISFNGSGVSGKLVKIHAEKHVEEHDVVAPVNNPEAEENPEERQDVDGGGTELAK